MEDVDSHATPLATPLMRRRWAAPRWATQRVSIAVGLQIVIPAKKPRDATVAGTDP